MGNKRKINKLAKEIKELSATLGPPSAGGWAAPGHLELRNLRIELAVEMAARDGIPRTDIKGKPPAPDGGVTVLEYLELSGHANALGARKVFQRLEKRGEIVVRQALASWQPTRKSKITDEQLEEVLRKHKGNMESASIELRMSKSYVAKRIGRPGRRSVRKPSNVYYLVGHPGIASGQIEIEELLF